MVVISNPSLSLGADRHGGSTAELLRLLAGHRCAVPGRREGKGASGASAGARPGTVALGTWKMGRKWGCWMMLVVKLSIFSLNIIKPLVNH